VVARRTLNATVLATGSIRAVIGAEVKVGSRVSGVVSRLPVNIGSMVHKGQPIAELDDRDARSQVDQAAANLAAARARLEQAHTTVGTVPLEVTAQIQQAESALEQAQASETNAETSYGRLQRLLDQGYIAAQDVDNARTAYEVTVAQVRHAQAVLDAAKANASQTQLSQQDVTHAEAAVRQAEAALRYAQTQLSYTRILSPIDGVIASVSTQEGETVAAGLTAPTFVTIIDLNRLQVDALVDETDIGRVKIGQPAVFTVDSFPDEEFEGTVTAIYPKAIIDQNVVDYDTVVTISNPRGLLRPDMTTNVTIKVATKENVLAVPNKAVKREESGRAVYVVGTDGSLERRPVKTGWKDSDYTEILSGLKEGEQVLVGEAPGMAHQAESRPSSLPPGATGK
jgi:multidrug efflux pump subunit AcrA (membrane-fusion protein)